jgi:membrane protein DedA with SNARE-associated domain
LTEGVGVLEFSLSVIESIGLLGAALLIAIEVIILPIPSELVLLLTGVNVGLGAFTFWGSVLATTVGSLVGAAILYLIGWWVSEERIRALVDRYGKYVGFHAKDFDQATDFFDRYGVQIVLFGRLIPVVRSLVSIPAGLIRMNPYKFFLFTAIGSSIWNTAWITAGFVLGENWEVAEQFSSLVDYIVYAVIAFIAIQLVIRFVKARKSRP